MIRICQLTFFLLLTLSFSCNDSKIEDQDDAAQPSAAIEPDLTTQVTNVFEEKFGVHEGKRRNHIDGFCFLGHLKIKDKTIQDYSKSAIFSDVPLSVVGRFSHKGGVKKDEGQAGEYGMAFQVRMAKGGLHNFSMNTLDFFPVSTPEGFLQLMQAKVSGKAEDFDKLKTDHPEFANYKAYYKDKPSELKPYSNHRFNSVNTFLLENETGTSTAVRWSFVPQNEEVRLDPAKKIDFFELTQQSLQTGKPLVWEMVISIANEDDRINDASVQWEGEHKQIVAATLTVEEVVASGACDDLNFDPLVLSPGFKPSEDPVLMFRSPAYASSFARRLQEKNK